MRSLLLLLAALCACGGKPSPPDPQKFRTMTEEQKCEATAPRAIQCIDELLAAQIRSVAHMSGMDPAEARKIEDQMNDTRSSADEAAKMHQLNCNDPGYTDAVVACWSKDPCGAFAECVTNAPTKRPTKPSGPSASPPSP